MSIIPESSNLEKLKISKYKILSLYERSEEYQKIVEEADRKIEIAKDREAKAYIKSKNFIAR